MPANTRFVSSDHQRVTLNMSILVMHACSYVYNTNTQNVSYWDKPSKDSFLIESIICQ